MTEKTITGIVSWLKGWFYDKTEITGFLNNKANQSDLNTTNGNLATLSSVVENKVDKVTGKGLSTEDFTTALKDKLNGIESEANKTVVDSALSSTSENPVQNKIINTALSGKAPTSHASSATTYGVGTTTNYGHVKTINGLTQASHQNGTALSAYQGKVLKDLIDTKSDFSGSYNDLTDVPSSFTPSTHAHTSNQINEVQLLAHIGTPANSNQHTINGAIDTAIGNLSSIRAIEVVTTLPTASSSTLGKLYIISENSKVNVYYTEQSGTGSSASYTWHKMDTDILDELSVDWSDITNKPSSFTPSAHTHGNITNDGAITSTTEVFLGSLPVVCDVSNGGKIVRGNRLFASVIVDPQAHSNIGVESGKQQSIINTAIDGAIGTINTTLSAKGALSDDIDWSYNSDDFVNGIKLVPKASDDTGAITFHLKG